MKRVSLVAVTVLGWAVGGVALQSAGAIAQTAKPTPTVKPLPQTAPVPITRDLANPWAPLVRIDPSKPFKIEIVNQTGVPVNYSLTTNTFSPRQLPPQGSTTLTYLPLPTNLLISSVEPRIKLVYGLTSKDNVITVYVKQTANLSDVNRTLQVQNSGGVFVF
jgi:hypothetical protein